MDPYDPLPLCTKLTSQSNILYAQYPSNTFDEYLTYERLTCLFDNTNLSFGEAPITNRECRAPGVYSGYAADHAAVPPVHSQWSRCR